MIDRRRIDWAAVRALYEARDASIDEIAERFGLAVGRVYHRAHRERWTMRTPTSRVRRLEAVRQAATLIEQQIASLKAPASEALDAAERVRAITGLVKLLEQVSKLERQHASERSRRRASRAARVSDQQMRDEIARRIEGLVCRETDRGAGHASGEGS